MAVDAPPRKKARTAELETSFYENQTQIDKRNEDLHNTVFGIDLLRDKILNFVIHQNDGTVSRKDALACRLVQHSWLNSVQKCLLKSGESLIHFNLRADHTTPPIRPFLAEYSSSSRLMDCIPPFSVNLMFDHLSDDDDDDDDGYKYNPDVIAGEINMNLVEKCLRLCNDGMTSLEVDLSYYCEQTPIALKLPENLSLPVLHTLSVKLPDFHFYKEQSDTDVVERSRNITNTTTFLQSILLGCKNLRHFRVQGLSGLDPVSSPIYETLRVPPTITKLTTGYRFATGDLEKVMMNNVFPNLAQLNIRINAPTGSAGTECVYRILERVRPTLKRLTLEKDGDDREITTIFFPLMPRLKVLVLGLEEDYSLWKDGVAICVDNIPNVKKMEIKNVSRKMLLRFVENSQLEATEDFKLSLPVPGARCSEMNQSLALSLTHVPRAFPNLSVLDISFPIRRDTPEILHPVFQNMPGLKVLRITTLEDRSSRITCSYSFWSSFFLGMSVEEINAGQIPHITHLKELQELNMRYVSPSVCVRIPGFLPNNVFDFGFFKMPKLLTLIASGGFSVTTTMMERWRLAGRIVYC